MKKILSYLILSLFLLTLVSARQQQMSLLSAYNEGNLTIGDVATIDLEIKSGQGRVFFQSYPLSKVDTQISTRFAKQYACDFLDVDCSGLDFFYTISAPSPIVGGPSAGAAITVLTIATLDNIKLNDNVIMTGTINSGGIIGPVGSIDEKIYAAKVKGFTKVLIPKWTLIKEKNTSLRLNMSNDNKSNINADPFYLLNKTEFGFSTDTIRVGHITEALYYFTDKNYSLSTNLKIPDDYLDLMNHFSILLCNKTNNLEEKTNLNLDKLNYSKELELLINLTNKSVLDNFSSNQTLDLIRLQKLKLTAIIQNNNSKIAAKVNRTYSQASFCFGTNVALTEIDLINQSDESLELIYATALKDLETLKTYVNSIEINSITKLQTKQLVFERILESEEYIDSLNNKIEPHKLAFFIERIYSAQVWSEFFNVYSNKQNFNQETLNLICKEKIMQAQERIAFIDLQTPFDSSDLDEKLKTALKFSNQNDNEMCIYLASQVKARSDMVLSTAHLYTANITELLDEKINIVEKEIAKEINDNLFPIAGISYLQYAKSLKEQDSYSSLLYIEYAIELGKMRMYLPRHKALSNLSYYFEDKSFLIFTLGFSIIFFLLFYLIFRISTKFKKKS